MIDKIEDNKEECVYCNGTGRTKEDPYKCKHCGRVFREVNLNDSVILENIYIPRKYKELPWKLNTLLEDIESKYRGGKNYEYVKTWANTLGNILNKISEGKIYENNTIYLGQNQGSSITRWCYMCLSSAERIGLNVNGILDLNDLDLDSVEDKIYVSNCDLLILKITNFKLEENLDKLNYLLPKRESLDKMTIMVSKLPYKYIESKIKLKTFDRPIVIERFV